MKTFTKILIFTLLPPLAQAETVRRWDDGGNNNSWNKAANWEGNNLPDGLDESAFFDGTVSGIGSTGTKAYVTNEGGDEGTTRNLYGLYFLTENSNEQWRIYANQGEVANNNVKIRVHNKIAHNLLNGGTASIFCTLEIVNDISWSMNGGNLLLSNALDGTGDINGVSGAQIDGLGSLSLKGLGNYSGTITTGQGTINILHLDVLKNATLNLNDTATNRLTYNTGANLGEIKGNGVLTLAGALNVGHTDTDSTFSGAISGEGSLVKVGSGTLTLTADSTNTGRVTVSGGAVQLGDGGTTGSVSGAISIANNRELIYNRSNDLSVSNISGAGDVRVIGSGALTLVGDHTNLGQATITSGQLEVTRDDSGSVSVIGRVYNDSKFRIRKHGNWLNTYSGLISGTGSTDFVGGQRESKFRLDRDQTYTGGTTIEKATLYLGNAGTAGWVEGNVVLNNGYLRFNRSDDKTFSGLISGSGNLEKYATGTITLTDNHTFTGATTVAEGSLLVHGSIGSGDVTVSSGAVLGGNGTIGGDIASAGTISPGASAGTLTTGGDVTITGDYLAEIDGASNDLLDVAGTLDISSATLDIDVLSGGVTENVYIIASYGSLTGTFSSITSLPSGYQIDYAFNGNNVAIIETQQPTVSSITTTHSSPTNANSISYTVTFSEAVTGFDALDDLTISGGTTATGVAISNPSTDNKTYLVAISGITGNGSLNLSVSTSGSTTIRDVANNIFTTTGSAVNSAIIIDNVAPQVAITTLESSPTNANSIAYSCVFTEPVAGFDSYSDIYITGTTAATTDIAATTVVDSGDSQSFTLTLNNISGDGFLQYRVGASNITDTAGNRLVISPTNSFDPFAPGLTVDNTVPVITLNGDGANISLVVGDLWSDPVSATDNTDASVTVVTGGDSVNTNSVGSYNVTYDATDSAGNVASQKTRTIAVISKLTDWANALGLSGDDTLPTADPDGDGDTNIEEFAFDGNPQSPTNDGKVVGVITPISTDDYFFLTFPVRIGASFSGVSSKVATVDGVTYTVQGTTDLSSWSGEVVEITPALDSSMPALSSGWGYRSFRFQSKVEDTSEAFIRVQVE